MVAWDESKNTMSLYQLRMCDTALLRVKCTEPLGSSSNHAPQSNWFLWIWIMVVREKESAWLYSRLDIFKTLWLNEQENQEIKKMQCVTCCSSSFPESFIYICKAAIFASLEVFLVIQGLNFLQTSFLSNGVWP